MENSEIIKNLRILGLDVSATPDDIHAAFRKLARELHPDITGSKSDFKFKQITSAYTALKNITPEELADLISGQTKPKKDIYDYYNIEKKRREHDEKIDTIIDKYEEELKTFYTDKTGNENFDIEAAVFRLKSKNPKIINITLKHSGNLVNKVEFRRAFSEVLKRPEIDENLANIISSLPFDDTTKKLIALDTSNNAGNFPTGLIISLIGNDTDVMESFLLHVKPDDVAVILRRWPSGKIMNSNIVKKLLSSNDARILVPVLGAMKTHFPNAALQHKKRLKELENHEIAAVRAWAKKLC